MIVLGISGFYHDSAAALVRDGRIVAAAQEERFSRFKADAGFPFGEGMDERKVLPLLERIRGGHSGAHGQIGDVHAAPLRDRCICGRQSAVQRRVCVGR